MDTMDANSKRKITTLNRYGVDNVSKLKSVQDKRRNTFESKRTTLVYYQEPRIYKINSDDCTLYRLDKSVADNWLRTYHTFGCPKGNVLSLGLVKDGTIYAVMTFKKSRNKKYYAELSRIGMLPGYDVIDGYNKLSSYASELGIYNIVAYVNLSFENEQDYIDIGMKPTRDIQPTKWWIKEDQKMSDASRRQKHLTETELVFNGWIPAYDIGSRVYVFE